MILFIHPDDYDTKEELDAELDGLACKLDRRGNPWEAHFLPPAKECKHNRIRIVINPVEEDINFTGVRS